MTLTLAAGEYLTAGKFNANTPYFKVKSVAQSVTSSTTFVDDTDLFFDLPAGRTYIVETHLGTLAAEAADFKTKWTVTGTLTVVTRFLTVAEAGITDVNASLMKIPQRGFSDSVSIGVDGGADPTHQSETLVVTTGASGGRLTMQWAQAVSSATPTQVTAGSFMIGVPVS